jgi:hypothetical protein
MARTRITRARLNGCVGVLTGVLALGPAWAAAPAHGSTSASRTTEKVAAAQQIAAEAIADPALLRRAYAQVSAVLASSYDGGDVWELMAPLIPLLWALQDEWLRQQPADQPPDPAGLMSLDPDLQVQSVALAADAWLVSTGQHGIGQLVLVTRVPAGAGGPLRVQQVPDQPDFDRLRCFHPQPGLRPCAARKLQSLPPDAQGSARVLIEAQYSQPAGATRGNQASLWRWEAGQLRPLYVTEYPVGGEGYEDGVHAGGDVISITFKGAFQLLTACGACDGRQLIRRLRLTAGNAVEDLDTTPLTPELDLVDTLLQRLAHHEASLDLAEAPAADKLERVLSGITGFELGKDTLFMGDPEHVTESNGRRELCLLTDDLPPLLLTFSAQGNERHLLTVDEYTREARTCGRDETAGR